MATNIVEILLKFRKEGDGLITELGKSVSELKKNLDGLGGTVDASYLDPLKEGLASAGLSAEEVQKKLKELAEATAHPLSSAYATGLNDALNSTDKSALRAFLALEEVQTLMSKGGKEGAYLVGLSEGLGSLNLTAQKTKDSIGSLNNIDLNRTKAAIDDVRATLSTLPATAAKSGEGVASALKSAESGVMSLHSAVKGLVAGFLGLAFLSYIKGATELAARTETLGTVLHVVGKNAGYSKEELDKADKSVQKMGITAEASRQALTSFIAAGLRLDLAPALSRAAQDLAVISGWNSSVTFSKLITNIQQMDTMGLRFMGIIVSKEEANIAYAASIGKTVSALSQQQKQEAMMVAVLEEATKKQGTYEAAMNDASKMRQSLTRYEDNAKVALGEHLLPAYTALVQQMMYLLSANKETAEGFDNTAKSGQAMAESMGVTKEQAAALAEGFKNGYGSGEKLALSMGLTKEQAAKLAEEFGNTGKLARDLADAVTFTMTAFRLAKEFITEHIVLIGGVAVAYGALKVALMIGAAGGLSGIWVSMRMGLLLLMSTLSIAVPAIEGAMVAITTALWAPAAPFVALVAGIALVAAAIGGLYYASTRVDARVALEENAKKMGEAFHKVAPSAKKDLEALTKNLTGWATDSAATYQIADSASKDFFLKNQPKTMEEAKSRIDRLNGALVAASAKMADDLSKMYLKSSKEGWSSEKTESEREKIEQSYKKLSTGIALVMDELDRKMKSGILPTLASLEDINKINYAAAVEEIDKVNRAFETVQEANKYWSEMIGKGFKIKFDTDDKALKNSFDQQTQYLHAVEKVAGASYAAIREITSKYYDDAITLEEDNYETKKRMQNADFSTNKLYLEKQIAIAKEAKLDTKALDKEMALAENAYREESITLTEATLSKVTALKEQAAGQWMSSLKKVADLERSIQQENMSFESKMFDLRTKLSQDGFKAEKEAIENERRALSRNTALSAEQKAQMEKALAVRSEALADKERASVKEVEAMIQNRVGQKLAEAQSLLSQGDFEGAKAANDEAKSLAGRVGTIAGEMKVLQSAHENTLAIQGAAKKQAEETAVAQKATFDTLTASVDSLKLSLEAMVSEMIKVGLEAKKVTLAKQYDDEVAALEKLQKKKEEMKGKYTYNDVGQDPQSMWTPAMEAELQKSVAASDKKHQALDKVAKDLDAVQAKTDAYTASLLKQSGVMAETNLGIAQSKEKLQGQTSAMQDGTAALNQHTTATGRASAAVHGLKDAVRDPVKVRLQMEADAANKQLDALNGEVGKWKTQVARETSLGLNTVNSLSQLKIAEARAEQLKNTLGKEMPTNVKTADAIISLQGLGFSAEEAKKIIGTPTAVAVDTAKAMSDIQSLATTEQSTSLLIPIDVQDDKAQADIAALDSQQPEVEVKVSANVSQAVAGIQAMLAVPLESQVTVRADISQAMSALDSIPDSKHTYVYVHTVQLPHTGGLIGSGGLSHLADGGFPSLGPGLVSGAGTGISDSIAAMLSNGEYVLRAAAVQHYGVDFISKLNQMVAPRSMLPRHFAEGGLVVSRSMQGVDSPKAANDSPTRKNDVVDINLNVGGKSYQVQSARDTAKQLSSALRELSRAS